METYVIRFTKKNSFFKKDFCVPVFFSLQEADFFLSENNIGDEFELINSSEIESKVDSKKWKVIWKKKGEII